MVIRDRVINDSYITIIRNRPNYGCTPLIHHKYAFINCDFVTHFKRTSFRYCTFTNCTFRYESFRYVYFYDCDFSNIIFKDDPRKCIVNSGLMDCHIDEKFKKDYLKTSLCPEKGEFIGWKKAYFYSEMQEDIVNPLGVNVPLYMTIYECIIKLQIPEDARRSCAFSNKCRCDKAKVLGIYDLDGNPLPSNIAAHSIRDNSFIYMIGKTITPREPFDDDPFNECSSGIHFFMSREEAVRY